MRGLMPGLLAGMVTLYGFTAARAQTGVPAREQVAALADSAGESTTAFEDAVKNATPWLDKLDPALAKDYLSHATTAHTIVQDIKKSGGSAYALVGLKATLDDMSLDAANGSLQLMAAYAGGVSMGLRPDASILSTIMRLSDAGDACADSAEAALHAALPLIQVEEDLLRKAAGK